MTHDAITVAWLENVPAANGYRVAWHGDFGGDETCAELIAEAPTQLLYLPLLDLVDAIDTAHSAPNLPTSTEPDEPDESPPGAYAPVNDDLLKRVHDAMLRKWNLTEDDTSQWRDRFAC